MKSIGSYFTEAAIWFGGTSAQKRWIRSLEQEGAGIASRIQKEQNAETATFFARSVAPLIRSCTRGHFCASPLPNLLQRYAENQQLVELSKAQIGRSVTQRSVSALIAFSIQISILFAVTQNHGAQKKVFISPETDTRPLIDRPTGWDQYTPIQKAAHISHFLEKHHLTDYHKAETEAEKVYIHNRFIRPLLPDGNITYRDCRDLVKTLHPDISGDSLVGGFAKYFCPTHNQSFSLLFNNK